MTITCYRCGERIEGLLEYENHARAHEQANKERGYGEDQYPERPHSFEAWPEEPFGDECYECEQPVSAHPMGLSRTTVSLRQHATLDAAREQVAAILGVDIDEVS